MRRLCRCPDSKEYALPPSHPPSHLLRGRNGGIHSLQKHLRRQGQALLHGRSPPFRVFILEQALPRLEIGANGRGAPAPKGACRIRLVELEALMPGGGRAMGRGREGM